MNMNAEFGMGEEAIGGNHENLRRLCKVMRNKFAGEAEMDLSNRGMIDWLRGALSFCQSSVVLGDHGGVSLRSESPGSDEAIMAIASPANPRSAVDKIDNNTHRIYDLGRGLAGMLASLK